MSDQNNMESNRLSHSMDELIMRTVGLMETLPERITKLESLLSNLEQKFAKHEGTQEQGVKRTTDRLDDLKQRINEIRKDFDNCKQNKLPADIREKVKELENKIDEFEKEMQSQFEEIKQSIIPLTTDLTSRENTKKTIKGYLKDIILIGFRYAMLPLTIAILILLGMNPKYIPWIKQQPVAQESGESNKHDKPSQENHRKNSTNNSIRQNH